MAELGEELSKRELGVLELIVDGRANKEIAQELFISPNTVKVHLRNIYTKLGVQSRTEAMTVAFQKGLATVPGMEAAVAVEAPDPKVEESVPTIEADPDVSVAETVEAVEPRVLDAKPDPIVEQPNVTTKRSPYMYIFALGVLLFLGVLAFFLMRPNQATVNEPAAPFVPELIGNEWYDGNKMPTARAYMASATAGLNIYHIGGETEAGVSDSVLIYDSVSGRWSSGVGKETAVSRTQAAVLNGLIYVPGGQQVDGTPTDVFELYSPANDAWTSLAPLPQPLQDSVVLTDGISIYLFGGHDGDSVVNDSYRYDIVNNVWGVLPPMEEAIAQAGGGFVGGEFILVGGTSNTGLSNQCIKFMPNSETWDVCAPMSKDRAGMGTAVFLDKLYVIGASDKGQPHGEIYEKSIDRWDVMPLPMFSDTTAWDGFGFSSVETRVFIHGGYKNGALSADGYIYAPLIYKAFIPAASGN